jgi:hypothetical protein
MYNGQYRNIDKMIEIEDTTSDYILADIFTLAVPTNKHYRALEFQLELKN